MRTQENNIVVVRGMEHCFCNALLNYNGALKYKTAKAFHDLILEVEKFSQYYESDFSFRNQLSALKSQDPFEYELITTKIKYPELNMATEYYFGKFENISDELYIIGMSPNNDNHIFDLVRNNKKLKNIVFYYFEEKDREYRKIHGKRMQIYNVFMMLFNDSLAY